MNTQHQIKYYISNGELDIEAIIRNYTVYIHKIISNIDTCKNLSTEDIEEIIDDTFLVIWKNSNKLDKDKLFTSYIAGVTKNIVKAKYRQNRELIMHNNIEDFENLLVSDFNIEEILSVKAKNRMIQNQLRKLKNIDRQIFIMYYYYSMKTKEISQKLGLRDMTVRTKLHRIRNKIKESWNKNGL